MRCGGLKRGGERKVVERMVKKNEEGPFQLGTVAALSNGCSTCRQRGSTFTISSARAQVSALAASAWAYADAVTRFEAALDNYTPKPRPRR